MLKVKVWYSILMLRGKSMKRCGSKVEGTIEESLRGDIERYKKQQKYSEAVSWVMVIMILSTCSMGLLSFLYSAFVTCLMGDSYKFDFPVWLIIYFMIIDFIAGGMERGSKKRVQRMELILKDMTK